MRELRTHERSTGHCFHNPKTLLRRFVMRKVIFTLGLSWLAAFPAVAEIHGVTVTLPDTVDWTLAHEASDESQYLREWIPTGHTLEDTPWLLVEQKLVLGQRMSAAELLSKMMTLASGVCTAVRLDGPHKKKLKDQKTAWGRIMCARQDDKDYGTFIDQRVLVDGRTAYVITSELRLPPTEVAGVLPFSSQQEAQDFLEKTEVSARVVQEGVSLCPETGC
jgi:hypothetical protein